MVEQASKWTADWAKKKAGDDKYVIFKCKDDKIEHCPFSWLKFQVTAQNEEGEAKEEEPAKDGGFVFDVVTQDDPDLEGGHFKLTFRR